MSAGAEARQGSGNQELAGLAPLTAEAFEGPAATPAQAPAEPLPAAVARPAADGAGARAGSTAPSAAPAAASGDRGPDTPWATSFGAVGLADLPTVLTVAGDDLYVGGTFDGEMAGMFAGTYRRVARWDGSGWNRLGDGVDGPVHAIAVVGADVYVGGEFTTAANGTVGAAGLARWDGTTWVPVAGGVHASQAWTPVGARALACDGTRLYVAGVFESVGEGDGAIAANGFAALDLRTGAWETTDGGLWWMDGPGEGRALALLGDRLLVGGSFDRAGTVHTASLAALDLATGVWTGFGAGMTQGDVTGTVDSLAADGATGTVYVGGRFTRADTVTTSGVATLTGDDFGSLGGFAYNGDPQFATVIALAHAGGKVYAAGSFTSAGDVAVDHWAVHDGSGWSTPVALDGDVTALAAYAGGVAVTGRFGVSGGLRLPHAGLWTGEGWQTFGQGLAHDPYADGHLHAVVATASGVFAGGFFDQAGPVPAVGVAEWREGAWQDLGGGVLMPAAFGTVHAMLGVGTDLYITGSFESVSGVPAANIARWDGERWSALGQGIQGTGLALIVLGGRLYVGGAFFRAGDLHASNVASWDLETQEWSAVGSVPTYDGDVMALAAIRDRFLIVGGRFGELWSGRFKASGQNSLVLFDTHAPPDPANPVAGYRRLPGVTFQWTPGAVRALQVLGDQLYVGGTFDRAGVMAFADPPDPGFPAANLASWRYDEGTWSTPGGTDHNVTAFATLEGRSLVVGGWFDHAGPIAASAVVEHDPAAGTWTAYGSGIGFGPRSGPTVRALAQSPADGLWVGGTFTVAGAAPSCNLALWRGTAGRTP